MGHPGRRRRSLTTPFAHDERTNTAMNSTTRAKWDERYREREVERSRAAEVLERNLHLLPATGRALDLACGLGSNALLLAERGLDTWAWDLSPVAVEKLRGAATRRGVALHAEVRDLADAPPTAGSFDVIVVAHFLERDLCPAIAAALRPDGLLFYQTFTRARTDGRGPDNDHFRLAEGELLGLFPDLALIHYHEEGLIGDTAEGLRNIAQLIGRQSRN